MYKNGILRSTKFSLKKGDPKNVFQNKIMTEEVAENDVFESF